MRRSSAVIAAGLAVSLMGAGAVPAWADTGPALPWHSPAAITNGVPVTVASIAPCPPVPTAGDTLLVQVNLSFGPGGGSGQLVSGNQDGSWAGQVTFYFFSGVPRQTTISAECLDFTGFSATPYAQYQTHHTQLFTS
jgi:hypothetical protein